MIFEFYSKKLENASKPFLTINVQGMEIPPKETHVDSIRAKNKADDLGVDLGKYFQIVDILTVIPDTNGSERKPVEVLAKCFAVKELKEMHEERVNQQRNRLIKPGASEVRTLTKR